MEIIAIITKNEEGEKNVDDDDDDDDDDDNYDDDDVDDDDEVIIMIMIMTVIIMRVVIVMLMMMVRIMINDLFFLVGYVEERPSWPIQSPNKGRKKKASSKEDREIRSGLLILDLKDGKL